MTRLTPSRITGLVCAVLVYAFLGPATPAADRLPAEKAGEIGQPTGHIAFIRDKDLWITSVSGQDQQLICQAQNADGRIAWSPDNRRLMFTRSGKVTLEGPDFLGGAYKVYDLFVALRDSAENGNTMWWIRVSDELGSRDA